MDWNYNNDLQTVEKRLLLFSECFKPEKPIVDGGKKKTLKLL